MLAGEPPLKKRRVTKPVFRTQIRASTTTALFPVLTKVMDYASGMDAVALARSCRAGRKAFEAIRRRLKLELFVVGRDERSRFNEQIVIPGMVLHYTNFGEYRTRASVATEGTYKIMSLDQHHIRLKRLTRSGQRTIALNRPFRRKYYSFKLDLSRCFWSGHLRLQISSMPGFEWHAGWSIHWTSGHITPEQPPLSQ